MKDFIKQCLKLKSHDVIKILEDHRSLSTVSEIKEKDRSILISIKIPSSLLSEFRNACSKSGTKYQTQIKVLMREWLNNK
jgi:predicted DNA binding CopG/RHH family protein